MKKNFVEVNIEYIFFDEKYVLLASGNGFYGDEDVFTDIYSDDPIY